MGIFDELLVKCPKCGNDMYEQFKPGYMDVYAWDEMPPEKSIRFDGTILECDKCGGCFELECKYTVTHKGIKEIPPQHKEWDEGEVE
jgi:hypothetical protein